MEGICVYCEESTKDLIFIQERYGGWQNSGFEGFEMACYDCLCRINGQWKHAINGTGLGTLEDCHAAVSVLVEKDEKNRHAKFTIREKNQKDHVYQIIEKKDELMDGFLVDCLRDGLADTIDFLRAYVEKNGSKWFGYYNPHEYRSGDIIIPMTHRDKIFYRDNPMPRMPTRSR